MVVILYHYHIFKAFSSEIKQFVFTGSLAHVEPTFNKATPSTKFPQGPLLGAPGPLLGAPKTSNPNHRPKKVFSSRSKLFPQQLSEQKCLTKTIDNNNYSIAGKYTIPLSFITAWSTFCGTESHPGLTLSICGGVHVFYMYFCGFLFLLCYFLQNLVKKLMNKINLFVVLHIGRLHVVVFLIYPHYVQAFFYPAQIIICKTLN